MKVLRDSTRGYMRQFTGDLRQSFENYLPFGNLVIKTVEVN